MLYYGRPKLCEKRGEFANALAEARQKGVRVLAYDCIVAEDELIMDREVEVRI